MIPSVGTLLTGQDLVFARPSMSVRTACSLLDREKLDALVVMQGRNLQGIVTIRDILHRVIVRGLDLSRVAVAQAMTPKPDTIDVSETVQKALLMMNIGNYCHLPVTRDGCTIGVVSQAELEKVQTKIMSSPQSENT